MKALRTNVLFVVLALVAACPWAAAAQPTNETVVREVLAGERATGVELWDLARWRNSMLALYEARGFVPLWFEGPHLGWAGSEMLRELQDAASRGLYPHDYAGVDLEALANNLAERRAGSAEVLAADVALSVVAARLAVDLHAGRVSPREMGHDLDVPHAQVDPAALVLNLARARDVRRALDVLEPDLAHYDLLKQALARYRQLEKDPAARLPADFTDDQLRRFLRAVGDLDDEPGPAGSHAESPEKALTAALMRFQRRHGLAVDGVLGPATRRELSVPISRRITQIALSLERARWLPAKLDTPPIIVNIPQFRLFAFRSTRDDESEILQMDVIVGESFPGRQTPVFAADMRYVVLWPYWDVPRSILLRELLPAIRRDPEWAPRNGYEIVAGERDDVPAEALTPENVERLMRGELRLRQKPGPRNALGRVKFMFPNKYNVYLHDTPEHELFSRTRRAFSHGCIRVRQPMALLEHVLRDNPDWPPERIEAALARRAPTRITLARPIRVFIVYGTAIANEAGEVLSFEDLYGHDARLEARLAARRPMTLTRAAPAVEVNR